MLENEFTKIECTVYILCNSEEYLQSPLPTLIHLFHPTNIYLLQSQSLQQLFFFTNYLSFPLNNTLLQINSKKTFTVKFEIGRP